MMAIDDLFTDPEAETRTGDSLGGVKGFEDSSESFGGHPGACVGDRKDQSWATGRVVMPFTTAQEKTAAALVHGVDGINEQVINDLANLAVKAEDWPVGSLAHFDGDVGIQQAAAQNSESIVNEIVTGDFCGAAGLPVEAKRLAGNGGGAL